MEFEPTKSNPVESESALHQKRKKESESADDGRIGSFWGVGSVEHGRISWCGMNRLPVLHSSVVAQRPILRVESGLKLFLGPMRHV
jgi:hypothetical protein